jgi:hypothetical protein
MSYEILSALHALSGTYLRCAERNDRALLMDSY